MQSCTLILSDYGKICESMLLSCTNVCDSVASNANRILQDETARVERARKLDYTLYDLSMQMGTDSRARADAAQSKLVEAKKRLSTEIDCILSSFSVVVTVIFSEGKAEWIYAEDFINLACKWVKTFNVFIDEITEISISVSSELKKTYNNLTCDIKRINDDRKANIHRQKVNTYWADRKEEKAALNDELSSIIKRIVSVREQMTQVRQKNENNIRNLRNKLNEKVPAEKEQAQCLDRIADLNSQLKRLGVLKGKQKKELQKQIDAEQEKLKMILQNVEQQKSVRATDVNNKIRNINTNLEPYQKQLNELTQKKQEIQAKMDRAQ